jgi:hypothetical protein
MEEKRLRKEDLKKSVHGYIYSSNSKHDLMSLYSFHETEMRTASAMWETAS